MKDFTVLDLIDLDLKDHNSLNLKCLAGRKGLARIITDSEINRPGLTLSGFFEEFAYHRIQLFGRGEIAYLNMLEENNIMGAVEKMFSYQISCCVFSYSEIPSKEFLQIAEDSEDNDHQCKEQRQRTEEGCRQHRDIKDRTSRGNVW